MAFCLFFSCSSQLFASLFSAVHLFDNQKLLLPPSFCFFITSADSSSPWRVWPSQGNVGVTICTESVEMENTLVDSQVHTLSFSFLQFQLGLLLAEIQLSHLYPPPLSPRGGWWSSRSVLTSRGCNYHHHTTIGGSLSSLSRCYPFSYSSTAILHTYDFSQFCYLQIK